jgi:hypothetical protein
VNWMSDQNKEDLNENQNYSNENENASGSSTNPQDQQPVSTPPAKPKPNTKLYIEIGIVIVGIILMAVASIQIKSIAHVKWNEFSEILLILGIIFIVSPSFLYFKILRSIKPVIAIIVIVGIGILLLYYLLVPYKMFTVHFGLLGDVIVEYLIGLFFIIFMVSHLTKVHFMKNKVQ